MMKLSGTWRDKTIDSLEKLIQYLFKRDAKRAKLIEIDDGFHHCYIFGSFKSTISD